MPKPSMSTLRAGSAARPCERARAAAACSHTRPTAAGAPTSAVASGAPAPSAAVAVGAHTAAGGAVRAWGGSVRLLVLPDRPMLGNLPLSILPLSILPARDEPAGGALRNLRRVRISDQE